jgi:hypothetical protein
MDNISHVLENLQQMFAQLPGSFQIHQTPSGIEVTHTIVNVPAALLNHNTNRTNPVENSNHEEGTSENSINERGGYFLDPEVISISDDENSMDAFLDWLDNMPIQPPAIDNDAMIENAVILPDPPSSLNTDCSICLEQFKCPTATLCGHVFCKSCINLALNSRQSCPSCNMDSPGLIRLYL